MSTLITLLYWLPELALVVGGFVLPWLLVFRLGRATAGRALAAAAMPQGLVDLALKGLAFPLIRLVSRMMWPYSVASQTSAVLYGTAGVVVVAFSGPLARMLTTRLSTNDTTHALLTTAWPQWGLRVLGILYVLLALGVWVWGR